MNACQQAAISGNLEALKQARSEGAQWDAKVCALAAENGHLDVLKWAHTKGCPWDARVCSAAARNGHLAVLQWARSKGCPWDGEVCYEAANGGHLEVFKWLCLEDCPWDKRVYFATPSQGHTEIVKWAYETGRPMTNACKGAAKSGNLEMLKWLFSKGCPRDADDCMSLAARGRHLHVVKWLRSQGCLVRKHVVRAALQLGDIELLQWADANGCGWQSSDDIVYAAASCGHFEMVKWLHSQEEDLHDLACLGAAISGHLEMLKWLHSLGCAWDDQVWEAAAENGSLEVLKWARESLWNPPEMCPVYSESLQFGLPWESESSPWDDKLICTAAAKCGHLDILKWAVANGAVLTELVCMAAAESGHFDVLTWARSQDPPCPYPDDTAWVLRRSGGKNPWLDWLNWESSLDYAQWAPKQLEGPCARFVLIDGPCQLTNEERVRADELLDKQVALVLCLRNFSLGTDLIQIIGTLAGMPWI